MDITISSFFLPTLGAAVIAIIVLTIWLRRGRKKEVKCSPTWRPRVPGVNTLLTTHREREVLRLLMGGMLDKEIACKLGISIWTIKGHMTALRDKLGCTSSRKLIVFGFSNHKGQPCLYQDVLCQEGWCSECQIFLEAVRSFANA